MADHVKTVRSLTKRINEATEPEDRAALSEQLADHWTQYNRSKDRA